jgi:hypothetical protein
MKVKIPNPDTIHSSAIAHLRELNAHEEADLLSRCRFEIGDTVQRQEGSARFGLYITLRCNARDLSKFKDSDSFCELPSSAYISIEEAIKSVLPAHLTICKLSARSFVVNKDRLDKAELIRLIEAQIDLMIAVATGGPRIQEKNDDYRNRKELIGEKLQHSGEKDPNPFEDLCAWYGRWSSGDLPSYQSRRDYVRQLYRPLLNNLAGKSFRNPAEPNREPTGWEKVDRILDKITSEIGKADKEEDYQATGLLCRECLISLAQAVFDPAKHRTEDEVSPSNTDAYRMLEAYFSAEFSGSHDEVLRRHAKSSLALANQLQHKRTAQYKEAALCVEATRTVVNIVAITSGRRYDKQ